MEAGNEHFEAKRRNTKLHSSHLRKSGAFFSPSEIKLEEREFVVDSRASLHMINKKDLNSDELETVTTSHGVRCLNCETDFEGRLCLSMPEA